MFELGDESLSEHKAIVNQLENEITIECYFVGKDFFANQVEKGNLEIKYCLSNDMIGDYYTKPLQGGKILNF